MSASTPNNALDSSNITVASLPTSPTAKTDSLAVPKATPEATDARTNTTNTVIERALHLLHRSANTKRLAERTIERISVPALRARTTFLLAQPKAQADLRQQLGNTSLTAVITRPDASENWIAGRLLGLDAVLTLSVTAARDGTAWDLAEELGRDAVVGAALANEEQLECLVSALANHMHTCDMIAARATELYARLVGFGVRVRVVTAAEQAYDAARRGVGFVFAALERRKWEVRIISCARCTERRV
jgi:hypothetical protein